MIFRFCVGRFEPVQGKGRRLVVLPNAAGALSAPAHSNRSVSDVFTHNMLSKPTDSNDVSEENAFDFIGTCL